MKSGEIGDKINDKLLRMQGKLFKEQGISKDGLELAAISPQKGDDDEEVAAKTLDKYLFEDE